MSTKNRRQPVSSGNSARWRSLVEKNQREIQKHARLTESNQSWKSGGFIATATPTGFAGQKRRKSSQETLTEKNSREGVQDRDSGLDLDRKARQILETPEFGAVVVENMKKSQKEHETRNKSSGRKTQYDPENSLETAPAEKGKGLVIIVMILMVVLGLLFFAKFRNLIFSKKSENDVVDTTLKQEGEISEDKTAHVPFRNRIKLV